MVDALSCLVAAVGDYTEVSDSHFCGHFSDDLEAMGNHGGILRCNGSGRLDMRLGNDQEVNGGLRVDVIKGIDLLVLIDLFGGNLSVYNGTKQTIHNILPPFIG
jgi:hypothetical protein